MLDGGGVDEAARHDELVAVGGLYARLWALHEAAPASDDRRRSRERRTATPRCARDGSAARLRGDRAPQPRPRARRLRRLERRARLPLRGQDAAPRPGGRASAPAACWRRAGCCSASPIRTSCGRYETPRARRRPRARDADGETLAHMIEAEPRELPPPSSPTSVSISAPRSATCTGRASPPRPEAVEHRRRAPAGRR